MDCSRDLDKWTSQSIIDFTEREILLRHKCPSRIYTDCVKPYMSAQINNFFAKFNIVHEVAAPYHSIKQCNG